MYNKLNSVHVDDILRTVLALYMDDENLPLPTLEEVLICDCTTTAEEVLDQYVLWVQYWPWLMAYVMFVTML